MSAAPRLLPLHPSRLTVSSLVTRVTCGVLCARARASAVASHRRDAVRDPSIFHDANVPYRASHDFFCAFFPPLFRVLRFVCDVLPGSRLAMGQARFAHPKMH